MRARLWHRWFALSVGLVGLTLGVLLWLQQQHFQRGLLEHANTLERSRLADIAERLAQAYAPWSSWQPVVQHLPRWRALVMGAPERPGLEPFPERERPARRFFPGERRGDGDRLQTPPQGYPPLERPPPPREGPPGAGMDFLQRLTLLDENRKPVFGPPPNAAAYLQEITLNDVVIGYLALTPLPALQGTADLNFAATERRNALWIALPLLLAAMLASLALSKVLLRRFKALADASRRLSAGDYTVRLNDLGSDELGELAADFDRLAQSLQQGREARDRWIADISHELRTPLTILRGELQSLQDGIRPLDARAIDSLAVEGERLAQRVDDLYALALSDSGGLNYRYADVDWVAVIESEVAARRPAFLAAGISIELDVPERAHLDRADGQRLQQLLANLLSNSLRYTDGPGRVLVRLRSGEMASWELSIDDSAPGVSMSDLNQIFERHYRGQRSSERHVDGAGLGLSICHNIVAAHDGKITAAQSALGGLQVRVVLPSRGRRA